MAFSARLPRNIQKSPFVIWEEVSLTDAEESEIEAAARIQNLMIMDECISDAKRVLARKSMKGYETSVMQLAIAFFEKRASHVVYHKERKAKEKFRKN